MEDVTKLDNVIFDPSLLIPPCNLMLKDIIDDHDFDISITQNMYEILNPPSGTVDNLPSLLLAWGARPEEAVSVIPWLRNLQLHDKFKIKEFQSIPDMTTFRSQIIDSLRRDASYNDSHLQFIGDEICLAIGSKTPIFCAETSSWKIVEELRKIGAKVKEESKGYLNRKADYFRTKKAWKEIMAEAGGIAFVWLVAGPVGLLPALGPPIIKVLVKDP